MIDLAFTTADAALIRFAYSHLWELSESVRVLTGPGPSALHLPWVRSVRSRMRPGDFPMLRALTRPHGYIVDFLTPPPTTPLPDLDAELHVLRATPPEAVRAETLQYLEAHRIDPVPEVLRPLLDTPADGLKRWSRRSSRTGSWPWPVRGRGSPRCWSATCCAGPAPWRAAARPRCSPTCTRG